MVAPNHLLYTPEQAANSTLAALRYQSNLARLVSTSASTDLVPGRGTRVTVKRPVMIDKARTYTREMRAAETPITYSDLFQPYTTVGLYDQVYNAVKLPDDFATFELESLEQQVIAPMAESVADHINRVVIRALEGVPTGLTAADQAAEGTYVDVDGTVYESLEEYRAADDTGEAFAGFGADVTVGAERLQATSLDQVLRAIRAAHQVLSQRGVPLQGRVLVVGANWEAALLALDNLNKVNESGDSGVLRQATLGRLYGFTIVVDYGLGANDAFAFQREAVTLATRTTASPRGAAFSSTVAAQGFTLRYLQDYDPTILTDRAVVDTFAGAEVLDRQRIVRLVGADTMMDPATADVELDPEV